MADGRTVRHGLLLRGGYLAHATDGDIRRMHETYHVKHVFDFRTETERKYQPDAEIPGAKNTWMPTIDMYTDKKVESFPDHAYRDLANYLLTAAFTDKGKQLARDLYPAMIDNEYTSNFFEEQASQYELQFARLGYLHELDVKVKETKIDKRLDNEDWDKYLPLVVNESKLFSERWDLEPFSKSDQLPKDRFSSGVAEDYRDWVRKSDSILFKRSQIHTRIIDKTKEILIDDLGSTGKLIDLQYKSCNQSLQDRLIGVDGHKLVRVVGDRLVPCAGQVFLKPSSHNGRAPFYSHVKILGTQEIPTLWYNLCVLAIMMVLVSLMLYTEDAVVSSDFLGDTRTSIFDACKLAYPERWGYDEECFIMDTVEGELKIPQKVLFIVTEMDKEELQTIILAYLSGVNEDHILTGKYDLGELDRVKYAGTIMKKYSSYFIIEEISEPNLTNVEATIKKYCVIDKIDACFFDYIHTTASLMAEFGKSGLREDSVLMLMANQLKQLAKDYNIFISTST